MYQIGDRVVYGMHGICQVVSLEERVVDRKRVTYLVLEPVGQGGSRFLIPAHNEAAMAKLQKLLNSEELEALLRDDRLHSGNWIDTENRRKQVYRELISGGDRTAILEMICSIYRHKEAQFAAGKKVHQCDDNFLRDAERLIADEIAVVMDLERPLALQYLRSRLKK